MRLDTGEIVRPDVLGWRDGFVTVLRAERHETVHAEPFDAVAIAVSELFGDDAATEPAL